jgi:deoxyribose-phosphate aldolase
MKFTCNDIAEMIDHALLHPTLRYEELVKRCAIAAAYETATVCVKPCHVEWAVQLLQASKTKVCE